MGSTRTYIESPVFPRNKIKNQFFNPGRRERSLIARLLISSIHLHPSKLKNLKSSEGSTDRIPDAINRRRRTANQKTSAGERTKQRGSWWGTSFNLSNVVRALVSCLGFPKSRLNMVDRPPLRNPLDAPDHHRQHQKKRRTNRSIAQSIKIKIKPASSAIDRQKNKTGGGQQRRGGGAKSAGRPRGKIDGGARRRRRDRTEAGTAMATRWFGGEEVVVEAGGREGWNWVMTEVCLGVLIERGEEDGEEEEEEEERRRSKEAAPSLSCFIRRRFAHVAPRVVGKPARTPLHFQFRVDFPHSAFEVLSIELWTF